ncbi:MAG: hypothetical protein H6642_11310 [Caldilineaceae bacterium]|nr:hypothetical protein [Caldilineaceae bacterium]
MTWRSSDNSRTMRWRKDGFTFTLIAGGGLDERGSLNQKGMIVFAQSIVPASQNKRLKTITP